MLLSEPVGGTQNDIGSLSGFYYFEHNLLALKFCCLYESAIHVKEYQQVVCKAAFIVVEDDATP